MQDIRLARDCIIECTQDLLMPQCNLRQGKTISHTSKGVPSRHHGTPSEVWARVHTSGCREAHVGGLHRRWQQSKYLIPGPFGVAIQVDGNLDLIRADLASNVAD